MSSIDFGYPWLLSYGHVLILIPALGLLALGWKRGWKPLAMAVLCGVVLWSAAALVVMQRIGVGSRGTLPTSAFLPSGEGRVLDIGAGTGRSSIMVLEARPRVTLVASDLFGDSFDHHFGHGARPQDRLLSNLKAAGVADRATIETADMRNLPFPAASFEGAVSAYAMDHLNREGSAKALDEAARVLKPGGDFLLILVSNDRWMKFAFGPVLSHGGTRPESWWRSRLEERPFTMVESGHAPATLWFLARKRSGLL